MSTYSLTLREIKGSALTYTELDNNFLYLEDLISSGSSGSGGQSGSSGSSGSSGVNGSSGTSGQSGSSGTSGQSGSSGTSGQDGSSGSSGQSGSSGTSGQDGSNGSSGQSGSSGTSGQDGSNGSSGVSGSSGTSGSGSTLPDNYRAGAMITHNDEGTPTTLAMTITTIDDLYFAGFQVKTNLTIDAVGIFWGSGSTTASYCVGIYDARTASVPFASPATADTVVYYPNNLLRGITFSQGPVAAGYDFDIGTYFKTMPDLQLEAGKPYFIGGYGSYSFGTSFSIGTLPPKFFQFSRMPIVRSTGIFNMLNYTAGYIGSATFSVAFPFTMATMSLPNPMPDGAVLTTNLTVQTNSKFLPMRIKSIP